MNRIRHIRRRKQMTQAKLAEKARIGGGAATISRYERDLSKMTLLTAVKLAEVLEVKIDELIGGESYENET